MKKLITSGGKYRLLSDRSNIIVMCDEAHRSNYDFLDVFAKNIRQGLPDASFIGFTGMPIDFEEVTESKENSVKSKLKSKWAELEALAGTSERLDQVAESIVNHYKLIEQGVELL